MSELRLADHRARRLAQRELVRPLLVEAGAGTGKTATLVARVLAWSLGPGWDRASERYEDAASVAAATLGGVVAVTFTEAAAAEMAERVAAALAEVAVGRRPVGFVGAGVGAGDSAVAELTGEDRRRAAALLGAADQLQVRTIHSFCRKLLAERAFDAGLHPHFTVDAESDVLRELVEERVEAAVLEGYGGPLGEGAGTGEAGDRDYLYLAGRGVAALEIAAALEALLKSGIVAEDLAGDPLAPERRSDLTERLWGASNRLLTLLEVRRIGGGRARNAAAIVSGLAELRRHLRRSRRQGAPGLSELQSWIGDSLPIHLEDHLRLWARGETANQAEKERLASVRPQLAELAGKLARLVGHVRRLDPELLASARRVLGPLLGDVREEMRRRGVVGFPDLLRGACELAERHPELLAPLRRRIDQLLVDEFQDTDGAQCELIRRLALTGPEGERPGLFVVGDPKQSIYGWRNADLAAYESFAAALETAGGERLALDENFRSVPAVLDEVERVVEPVMRRRPGLQPEFRSLFTSSSRVGSERSAIEHWVSWCPAKAEPAKGSPDEPLASTARETAELEARALVADLLERHRCGVAFADVALLLRSLTDLEVYLAALREARIPFAVSRDRQYYRRREVIDAAALVRTVLTPEDQVATVAFLRSAVVGVPDAALVPLWKGGLPVLLARADGTDLDAVAAVADLARRVAAGLPGDVPGIERVRGWHLNLAAAAVAVGRLRRLFESEPADVFVGELRRTTLLEPSEAARYLGAFRLANLDRFFAELLAALESEAGDRHRVLRRLRRRLAEGFEAEEARPGEAAEDAVQVMTIHKAKGLEFRHVYLLQTHKEAGLRPRSGVGAEPVTGTVDGRAEYRLFGAATLGFDRVEERTEEVRRAELVRTLYVAMTRAAERLVLVGRPAVDAVAEPLERASTHVDLLLHRRGSPSIAELADLWRRGAVRHRDGDVLFYLPGRAPEGLAAEALEGVDAPELAATEDVLRTAERLRLARRSARGRMERPFRQVASKLASDSLRDADRAAAPEPGEERTELRRTDLLPPAVPGAGRRIAAAAGSAVHRVFESFDLEADFEPELDRQRALLPEHVALFAEDDDVVAVLERARLLLERFADGTGLRRRFADLKGRFVAREMPVLLAPVEGSAVGYLAGVVDLVYRDPDSGNLVVADWKTDAVWTEDDVRELSARYAAQGGAYARALREALDLVEPPRFELWLLAADRVEVVASPP